MAGLQVEVPWEECVRVEGRDTQVEEDRAGKGSEEDTRKAEGSTVGRIKCGQVSGVVHGWRWRRSARGRSVGREGVENVRGRLS